MNANQLIAALALLLFQPFGMVALAAYDMKVSITFPAGSAGEKNTAPYPANTKISPCNSRDFDALTFAVTYDATNSAGDVDRDVYFFLHNPEAQGAPRFMVLHKQGLGSSLVLVARNSVGELSPSQDIYLPRGENLSPQTESLISSVISAQAAAAGIWQVVGIVADGTDPLFSFDDPSTWDAWDVATVILRKPWMGNWKNYCE